MQSNIIKIPDKNPVAGYRLIDNVRSIEKEKASAAV